MIQRWEDWLLQREGFTQRTLTPEEIEQGEQAQAYADREGLEWCGKHDLYHIFYDPKEGKWYNRKTDMYLDYEEARSMGIAA